MRSAVMKESQLDLLEPARSHLSLKTRAATAGRTLGRGIPGRPSVLAPAAAVRGTPGGTSAPAAEAEVKMEGEGWSGYLTSCATGGERVEREAHGRGAS